MILQNINSSINYSLNSITTKLTTYNYSYVIVLITFILVSLVFTFYSKRTTVHKVLGLLFNTIFTLEEKIKNLSSYKTYFYNNIKFFITIIFISFVILLLQCFNLLFYFIFIILIYKIYDENFIKWEFSFQKTEHNYISLCILFYVIFSILFSLTIILKILETLLLPTISFFGIIIFTKLTVVVYVLLILRLFRSHIVSISLTKDVDKITYVKHEMLSWVLVMLLLNYIQIYQCDFRFSIIIMLTIILNYTKFSHYINKLYLFILNNFKNNKNLILLIPILSIVKHNCEINDLPKTEPIIPKWGLNKTDYSLKKQIPTKKELLSNLEKQYKTPITDDKLVFKKHTLKTNTNSSYKYSINKQEFHKKPEQIINQTQLVNKIQEFKIDSNCKHKIANSKQLIFHSKTPIFTEQKNILEKITDKHDPYLKYKQRAYELGTLVSKNVSTVGLPRHFINDHTYRSMTNASSSRKIIYIGRKQLPVAGLDILGEVIKQPYKTHLNNTFRMHNFNHYKK